MDAAGANYTRREILFLSPRASNRLREASYALGLSIGLKFHQDTAALSSRSLIIEAPPKTNFGRAQER